MQLHLTARALVAALALPLIAACNNDSDSVTGPNTTRVYVQIQRLGNPLVSEVFFPKRLRFGCRQVSHKVSGHALRLHFQAKFSDL